MNILLAQIIVAARRGNDKDTGWMQLLIVVVAAAIYGLVGILKTKANKLERKRQEQPGRKRAPEPSEGTLATKRLPTRPDEQARRPSPRTQLRQYRPQVRPPGRKIMRPHPSVQKFVTKTKEEPVVWPETLEPQLQPELKDIHIGIPSKTEQPETVIESLLGFDDPDMLRKAILHYEILGRPLSLRSPSEHIAGL